MLILFMSLKVHFMIITCYMYGIDLYIHKTYWFLKFPILQNLWIVRNLLYNVTQASMLDFLDCRHSMCIYIALINWKLSSFPEKWGMDAHLKCSFKLSKKTLGLLKSISALPVERYHLRTTRKEHVLPMFQHPDIPNSITSLPVPMFLKKIIKLMLYWWLGI